MEEVLYGWESLLGAQKDKIKEESMTAEFNLLNFEIMLGVLKYLGVSGKQFLISRKLQKCKSCPNYVKTLFQL